MDLRISRNQLKQFLASQQQLNNRLCSSQEQNRQARLFRRIKGLSLTMTTEMETALKTSKYSSTQWKLMHACLSKVRSTLPMISRQGS